jgi:hypothetical protein
VERFCNTQDNFIGLRQLNMNLDIFFDPYDDNWAMGLVNLLKLAPLLEELEVHVSGSVLIIVFVCLFSPLEQIFTLKLMNMHV